jgi:hypothetical protein
MPLPTRSLCVIGLLLSLMGGCGTPSDIASTTGTASKLGTLRVGARTFTGEVDVTSCAKVPSTAGVSLSCAFGPVTPTIDLPNVPGVGGVRFIAQVPAGAQLGGEATSCTNVFGTHFCSYMGALRLTQGVAAIPIDASTTLHAEPGMTLAIIDAPVIPRGTEPPGRYGFKLQWGEPFADTIKLLFVAKVDVGGTSYYPPLLPCTGDMAAVPAIPATGPLTAVQVAALVVAATPCSHKVYDFGNGGAPAPVEVVEFYHAGLDHYFITWVPDEIAALDAGTQIKGWVRTGKSFKAYSSAVAGASQVCRFYIPPGYGDSHFFGRGQQECDDTARKFPQLELEDAKFMYMFLPVNGSCPPGLVAVHRAFSNRADANHRYFTDVAVGTQMQGLGWLLEGDGPDLVVMCAPA